MLATGKETDTSLVEFAPEEIKNYYDLVVDNILDPDYNEPIYKDYIAREILVSIDIPDVIVDTIKFIFIQNSGNPV